MFYSLREEQAQIPRGTPYNRLYEEASSELQKAPSSRLQVYERVRISIVEVYERVEKSVSFRSVKGPKRADRRILCL